MKWWKTASVVFVLGLCLLLTGCPGKTPVSIAVVFTPYAVPNSDGTVIVYELLLSDYRTKNLEMKTVEVFADGALLRTYTDADWLRDDYTAPVALIFPKEGAASEAEDACKQPVLYFAIPLTAGEKVPATLSHKIYFAKNASKKAFSLAVEGGTASMNTEPLPVIAPPLRGSRMAITEAISPRTHHRTGISMIDGKPFISQRFAIDYFQLTEQGTMAGGDPSINASYPGYGADLLAVAPGKVVKIVCGVVDNETPPGRSMVITNEIVGGNLVVIQIAENQYAFYGHCIPGSILVHLDEEVVTGQVIARMGNSGNSDAPHLHFELANSTSLFESQGIPYIIDDFSYDADYPYWTCTEPDFAGYASRFTWTPRTSPEPRTSEFVKNGTVVTFD